VILAGHVPRRVIGSAVLAGMVLSACGIVGSAWPNGSREAVCSGTDHLQAADAQLAMTVAAMQSQDAELVAIGATGIEREAAEALAALEQAEAWGAGAELVGDLQRAAAGFERAAGQFRAGARQGNGPAYDAAVADGQGAEADLGRAALDAERLTTSNGWQPC
jgi:hypothetical protein